EVTDNSYLLVFNFFDIVESYMGIYPYLDELIELIKLNDSNPSKDEIEDPYIKDIEEALNMHAIKFNEDTPEIDKYQVEIFRDILKSGNYIEIINFYIKNKNVGVFNEIENLEARIKELAIALSLEREINLEQVEEEYRSYVKRNILEPLKTKDFAKILGELKRKEKLVKLLKVDEAYINSFIEIAENYLQYSRSNQNNPLPAEVLEILRKRHKLRSNSKEKNIMISDPYLRDFEETLQIKEENIILEAQKEKILNALANSNFENGYLPLVKLVDTQKGVLNSFPHAQEAYNELEITLVLLSKSNDYVKKIESMLKDKKFGKLYAEFKTIGIDTLSDRLDIDRSEIKKFLNIAERYMDRKSEEKEINVRCDNDRIVFYIGDELQGEKLFIKGSFFDNRDTEVYRLGWTSVDIDYDTNIGYIKMENRLNTSSFSKFKGRVYAE
ncbi:MAG: hypothetical protein J7K83_02525, partial [Candidatus Aenigmarchaeota archaeon]|nr:hypothetical protein [Candidatus Aenigmarchaeota archaeon]